ncbi:hypothetical protein I7I48_02335 [Histoplasma ohiense]|nr:hypothetical protein I7I48_02335 [Histoplasma ohiense (nom. inval.)]
MFLMRGCCWCCWCWCCCCSCCCPPCAPSLLDLSVMMEKKTKTGWGIEGWENKDRPCLILGLCDAEGKTKVCMSCGCPTQLFVASKPSKPN